ncbi:MAG: glycosyl hydrolase family 18 protein, partial [Myxococcota bacterium]
MNKRFSVVAALTLLAALMLTGGCADSAVDADSGYVDTGHPDASTDAGHTDAAVMDTGHSDASTPDAGSPDAAITDTGYPDASPADTGDSDTSIMDTGNPDGSAADAGYPDAAIIIDTGYPDAFTPDASTADSGIDGGFTGLDGGADAGSPDGGQHIGDRHFNGYFPSWSENWFDDQTWNGILYTDQEIFEKSKMASLPDCYTHVTISFVRPDVSFDAPTPTDEAGSFDVSKTGLQFSATMRGTKAAVRVAHNRGMKVILAVGGASYSTGQMWAGLTGEAGKSMDESPYKRSLKNLVDYLGADGLDVDYEIEAAPGSQAAGDYARAIIAMREAVDAAAGGERLLTLAGWSTGADCTYQQFTSPDPGVKAGCSAASYWGGSAGRERDVLQRSIDSLGTGAVFPGRDQIADLIDEISIMSYDAGCQHYDPVKAFSLYRAIFPEGHLNAGFETAPESWGGAVLVCSNSEAGPSITGTWIALDQESLNGEQPYSVERTLTFVRDAHALGGAMIWTVLKEPGVGYGCSPAGVCQKTREIFAHA